MRLSLIQQIQVKRTRILAWVSCGWTLGKITVLLSFCHRQASLLSEQPKVKCFNDTLQVEKNKHRKEQ